VYCRPEACYLKNTSCFLEDFQIFFSACCGAGGRVFGGMKESLDPMDEGGQVPRFSGQERDWYFVVLDVLVPFHKRSSLYSYQMLLNESDTLSCRCAILSYMCTCTVEIEHSVFNALKTQMGHMDELIYK